MGSNWDFTDTLISKKHNNPKPSNKVAAFDFDGCLVQKSFSDRNNCSPMFGNVVEVLKSFHDAGYLICIISNQGEIGKATKTKQETIIRVLNRFDNFLRAVNIPVFVLASTTDGEYRKPNPGMWGIVKQFCNPSEFFFVGDAAGRPGDHSDSDKQFAANCGIKQFFDERQFFKDGAYSQFVNVTLTQKVLIDHPFKTSDVQEVVIMVGGQASGKTTYANRFEAFNYSVIHGDDYASNKEKIIKEVVLKLSQNKSVVIDATNGTIERRKFYLDKIRNYKLTIPIRVVHMSAPKKLCVEKNNERQNPVHIIALHKYFKNFEEPTQAEGFAEIMTI